MVSVGSVRKVISIRKPATGSGVPFLLRCQSRSPGGGCAWHKVQGERAEFQLCNQAARIPSLGSATF